MDVIVQVHSALVVGVLTVYELAIHVQGVDDGRR